MVVKIEYTLMLMVLLHHHGLHHRQYHHVELVDLHRQRHLDTSHHHLHTDRCHLDTSHHHLHMDPPHRHQIL